MLRPIRSDSAGTLPTPTPHTGPRAAPPAARVRAAGHRPVISLSPRALLLLQTLLVVGPALAAVRIGSVEAGAQWLFASLCGLLALQTLFGHGIGPLALLVAVLPAVMLLRSRFQ